MDFAELERRLLAHQQGKPQRDLHRERAAHEAGILEKDVTHEQREAAKHLNFPQHGAEAVQGALWDGEGALMRSLTDELVRLIRERYFIKLEYDAQFRRWSVHVHQGTATDWVEAGYGSAGSLRDALREAVTRWKEEHRV